MSVDSNIIAVLLSGQGILLLFKTGFVAFSVVYFIFSLIIIRQVFLLADTVITEGDSILEAVSVAHSVLALGVVVFFVAWF